MVAEGVFLALTSCLVAIIPALELTAVLGAGLGDLFLLRAIANRASLLTAGIWLALAVLGRYARRRRRGDPCLAHHCPRSPCLL